MITINTAKPKYKLINTSHPISFSSPGLLEYLRINLSLNEKVISLGLKKSKSENAPLPIVLWSLGVINSNDLELLVDWNIENNL